MRDLGERCPRVTYEEKQKGKLEERQRKRKRERERENRYTKRETQNVQWEGGGFKIKG